MDELIARLEAASEGSRELDAVISVAIFKPIQPPGNLIYATVPQKADQCTAGTFWHHERSGASLRTAPHYTTSLDAALTLVPEGWVWKVSNGYSVKCSAELAKPVNTKFGAAIAVRSQIFGQATPALALCIAALRARSHTAPQEK